MQIAVIGSGYVGLVVSACFAELGHKVVCVDSDAAKIEALSAGKTLIHETLLPELLNRHRGESLFFSTSLAGSVQQSLVIVITVGTPGSTSGGVDLSQVQSAILEIARSTDEYKLIVQKSTVPVHTSTNSEDVVSVNGYHQFEVASNPEFLREGTAVTDFLYPDRIIVGTGTERASAILSELYRPLTDGAYSRKAGAIPPPDGARVPPLYIETSPQSARLIKQAANAFLALKISFINAVASICEATGADIADVARGLGSDSRIGSRFLKAGIGYGGSCLPKDVAAFRAVAQQVGFPFALLDEVEKINNNQRLFFLERVKSALGTLAGKRLAVLGLAFKAGTDDVRNSPAVHIVQSLLQAGCDITAFDPAATSRAQEILGDSISYAPDAYSAMHDADALLILSEWKEFAALDPLRIKTALRSPIVFDGRNLYSPEEMNRAGLRYHSVGRAGPQAKADLPSKAFSMKISRSENTSRYQRGAPG